jgi:hypothetical protein
MNQEDLFKPSYESDYLKRELGGVTQHPDIALTELVANAYDAGANRVDITVPSEYTGALVIEDNGIGMTQQDINDRWLKLRYNRLLHQGQKVEFPVGKENYSRKAFGKNGIGRHALFCFADEYILDTWRNDKQNILTISVGKHEPIKVVLNKSKQKTGNGTKLSVYVERNLWPKDRIVEMLATKFLSMPDFQIYVNNELVDFEKHPNVVEKKDINIESIKLRVTVLDHKKSSRTSKFKGLGIWINGRRVGEMDWQLANVNFADGRKSFSTRFAIIVETENLMDEVLEDWSGFKPKSDLIKSVAEELNKYVQSIRKNLLKEELEEIKKNTLLKNKPELDNLPELARDEISQFIDEVLEENPDLNFDILQLAVKAAINLEKSHHGQSLLIKLTEIDADNVDALNEILDEWNARDALKALSEIDERIKVIETLSRLSNNKNADELTTIHPLILKAKWLFGPEYETSAYSSNVGLIKTIQSVFNKKIDSSAFVNSSKRPDIVVLKDSSLTGLAMEDTNENGLVVVKKVLLIEVKKGNFPIGREEMTQADNYVQDIAYSGVLSERPFVNAFVVGHEIKSKTSTTKNVSDENAEIGKVVAVTFSSLIATAEARLFRLRNKLRERYDLYPTEDLQKEILGL